MEVSGKRIAVVGAGPGGLTAAMILARRGFDVQVFEKGDSVGGRNACLDVDGFKFDLGPTFLMMKYILDEVFELADRRTEDYMDIYPLDPMYTLNFGEKILHVTSDHARLKEQLARLFPGEEKGLDAFLQAEGRRYEKMRPCLEKPYMRFTDLLRPPFTRAAPYLSLTKSVYQNLGRYFSDETLRICFSFQSKYLGMSPWECPAAFTIIPYVEHAFGIYHVRGGLSEISQAMAKVVREHGGIIHTGATVQEVVVENGSAKGVLLKNGERFGVDDVVINADFGHAMTTLFAPGVLKKYTPAKVAKKKYSCSTFMLYLGLDKLYDEPHHTIFFAKDYRTNIQRVAGALPLPDDFSLYLRNASITDPTLAPAGKSAVYALIPVANNRCDVDWDTEKGRLRRAALELIKRRTSMKDIEDHIVAERVVTPRDWAAAGVYLGATFNLAHSLDQMLMFRPRNRFEEVDHCYLVGGGTHPGSGLPTIYESGRIAANLLTDRYNGRLKR